MRDENYRLAGKTLIADKDGQHKPQKASSWVVSQMEDFLSAKSGPAALVKEEFKADTFSPQLQAMVS